MKHQIPNEPEPGKFEISPHPSLSPMDYVVIGTIVKNVMLNLVRISFCPKGEILKRVQDDKTGKFHSF